MRKFEMKKDVDDTAYDGRRIDEMAPYARKLGEANARRDSRLCSVFTRMDTWWEKHPRTRRFIIVSMALILIGVFLNHMLTFPTVSVQ